MASFGIDCISKNRKPICDKSNEILTGKKFNPQGVLYISDTDSSIIFGAVNSAFEFGDSSAASGDTSTLAGETLTGGISFVTSPVSSAEGNGNSVSPATPTDSSNTRRLRITLPGVYHYDLTIIYELSGADGTEVLRFGPTVRENDGNLLFLTDNAHSVTQKYGTEAANPASRNFQVSGNLILEVNNEIGVYRNVFSSGSAIAMENPQVILRIFRVSS